jgi:two-component system nitrate/nitrite response regulator NarL
MKPLRILLVDDHVLFRKGMAALISGRSDLTVVAEAEDGVQAVRAAYETLPDIMLMDIHMPNQDGLETLKIIRKELPDTQVIMLTVSDDDDDLFVAIKSGAKGYLLKNLDPQELYSMLDKVRRGEAAISGAMAAKILQEFRQPEKDKEQAGKIDALTDRETEVLEEVVTGATNKEIAERLHITENTVKIHLRNILEKMQVDNRIQAAVHAVREGMINDSVQKK